MREKVFVSLGFACEARVSIQYLTAQIESLPFDSLITKKYLLLDALRNNGCGFNFKKQDCSIYLHTKEGIRGLCANRLFFWHAVKDETGRVLDRWPDHIDALCEQYQRRWTRFATLCRDDGIEKQFILTNASSDLPYFLEGGETFADAFGLDELFLSQLLAELENFGVNNFRIHLMVRHIAEYLSLKPFLDANKYRLSAQYVGEVKFPPHEYIVKEMGHRFFNATYYAPDISIVCGTYLGGMIVRQVSDQSAIITNNNDIVGEARIHPGGFLFVFENGPNFVLSASFVDGKLWFLGGANWTKAWN